MSMPLVQNPEFRRNLWLEFSPQRLVLMPLVILLVLFVIGKFDEDNTAKTILTFSLLGFAGLTVIWGCIRAGNALGQEFSDGAWDSQRMSSLTPWQMTWGKLLGGALYAWYGGGILLLIAFFAAGAASAETGWRFAGVLRGCVGLALLALLAQTLGMMQTLLLWQRHPGKARGYIGIIGLLVFLWMFGGFFSGLFGNSIMKMLRGDSDLSWYGMEAGADFMLLSLFALVVWAVIGLWQRMRRELLLRNRPWWWLAFQLFWMAWGAGFITQLGEEQRWAFFFAFCAVLTWASVYPLIFFEKKDTAFWIRLRAAWQRRDGALLQHLLPNWLVSFALALVLSLLALLLSGPDHLANKLFCLISVTAFVLRDTAWILWLNLKPGARRPDGAALVSLAVAYGVLPWLSARVFLPLMWERMEIFTSWKHTLSSVSGSLAILALHILLAAAALWLLYARFNENVKK
jgi:hypothetical protein